ncbi:MAG: flagellar hook-associated protein FlgL [Veillonellales bacterium]
MRITNNMTIASTLKDINDAANRLAAANKAVSSEKKIQLASDDPIVATRAVTYRSYVSQITQYQDNADAATGWQKATDSALSDLSDVITSAKELATEAASSTCSDTDKSSIKTQIETLQTEAISIMNTTYDGRYIFGGYSTGEAPYESTSTSIGDTVTFKGDYLSLGGVVSSDISDSTIESYYTSNEGDVYDSLTTAAAKALTAYNTAESAYAADSGSTTLGAAAATAKATSDTLAAAVTTYGGSTNLTVAAASAKTTYETLTAAVTTYGGSTSLSSAAAQALTAYNTAEAAYTADSSNSTLETAAATAKTTSDALAAAVTAYGGTTTLTDAATAAKTTSDTLAAAVTSSEQNINYNIGFNNSKVTVNIEGQDVAGEGTGSNLFDTFSKMLLALDGDTSYKTAEVDSSGVTVTTNSLDISDLIDEFSTDLSRVTVAQATLGARMDNVSNVTSSLGDAYTAYETLMSDNEDVDTATAATEQTSAEYSYDAALTVGAKAISKTLVDYLG